MKNFIKAYPEPYGGPGRFVFTRLPTEEELENLICKKVPEIRCLRFHTNVSPDPVPDYHNELLTLMVKLAIKYRPWQFCWLSQESGSLDFVWVEVEDWYYKYKNKSGWVLKK